jgi:hypothetical protein
MPGFPIQAASYQQLIGAANPVAANQPETIPYWFYDTQLFTSATTIDQSFFTVTVNNRARSNWQQGGALPDPNFFAIHQIMADIIPTGANYVTETADQTGLLDDLGILMLNGLPRITVTISDKDYGPWPFSLCHATGGPTGVVSSTVATVSQQVGNNGIFDGGLPLQGAIIIPPKVAFAIRVTWNAAVTLTDDYDIRLTMGGVLYRRVS